MNADSPENQRQPEDARITDLLFGELSNEEAAATRQAMAEDPRLRQRHEQLARTIELVRQATSTPVEQKDAPLAALRLSDERRARLLESFRSVTPVLLAPAQKQRPAWFIPMSLAATLVALLGLVAFWPGLLESTKQTLLVHEKESVQVARAMPESLENFSKDRDLKDALPRLEKARPESYGFSPDGSKTMAAGKPLASSQSPPAESGPTSWSLNLGSEYALSAVRPAPPGQVSALNAKGKVPVLGDSPATGRFFFNTSAPDQATAATTVPGASPAAGQGFGGIAGGALGVVGVHPSQAVELASSDYFEKTKSPNGRLVQEMDGRKAGDATLALSDQIASTLSPNSTSRPVKGEAEVAQKKIGQLLADQERRALVAVNAPEAVRRITTFDRADVAPTSSPSAPQVPAPEIRTAENPFSTFSLNVSDVSFRLAAASLQKTQMPQAGSVRSEEFINAFDYRDPEPPAGTAVAFTWEQARSPFAQDRDLLRFSIKTAAQGRALGRPLNLVLVLDRSGSMERADRVAITHQALGVLAGQLQARDKLSVITFARTARLWADGVSGSEAKPVLDLVGTITPEGGTNLEEALRLAYETARKQFVLGGINRVVLLTDGAANLGEVDANVLQRSVETQRQQGVALDCFGIGWEGFNDNLLETLASHGDGRYGFLNTPEEAASGFAQQLAGALRVAAADVKVQVEFNPNRVTFYRQIGYEKHQLTKEQFRDNAIAAAELGAAESGNALYVVQVNAAGQGDLGTVRVRYKTPETGDVHEQEWPVPYTGTAVSLEQASPALRLAVTAAAFAEWLTSSPDTAEVTPDRLLGWLNGVPEAYTTDPRPKQLEWMIRQAQSLTAK